MGIYNNGIIYGIKFYTLNEEDIYPKILLQIENDEKMTQDQMKEIYEFYCNLKDKNNLFIKFYTECCSTYSEGVFMDWFPMSVNIF